MIALLNVLDLRRSPQLWELARKLFYLPAHTTAPYQKYITVASLGGEWGLTTPGDTLQEGDTRGKKFCGQIYKE